MNVLAKLVKNKKAIGLLILAVLLVTFASQVSFKQQSILTSGWEIYDQISAIRCDAGVKSGAGEFTYPNEVGAVQWKFDVDEINYNQPTIMIQTSDLRHVDASGTSTPSDMPVEERTVERGNHTYYLDYHIYLFDVTIRTIADKVRVGTVAGWVPLTTYPKWEHETSWGYSDTMHTMNSKTGKMFTGGAYVKFVISPWRGGTYHDAPEDYVIQNAWAGVMNSYVDDKTAGQVANQWGDTPTPSSDAPMRAVGALDDGAQVNMYLDNGEYGTESPTANWDTDVSPDSRIVSNVVLYLPVQLNAGAYLTQDFVGGVTELNPCDVYVKYTVRVDVLQTHDFVLQTAYKPPELTTPEDYFSYALGFWDNFWRTLNDLLASPNFFFLLILVALGIAVWFVFFRKKGDGKPAGSKKRFYGLSLTDWAVIGFLLFLGVIPDPTDLLDFGLPVIEGLGALAYFMFRRKGKGGEQK